MTELLVVLAIIAVLSITGVPAFVDFLGHNNLKNASLEVASVFNAARQLSITNRKNYKVVINNVEDVANNLYYAVKIYQDSDGTIQNWKQLARTIEIYSNTFPTGLVPYPDDSGTLQSKPIAEFYPDGHMGSTTASLGLREKVDNSNTKVIRVYNTTGIVKVQ